MSFKGWIALGRYVPTIVQNAEFLYELESLTKEIEMKMESLFSGMEDGDSDYDEEDDEDGEE